ncbi:uncharacterized protein LOC132756478 [Ruditapes philippinarum]|uniref:uncharacterized protein LOC132756478 n=1 Tax=Ruditapes philippinarum TaxID=129788 RepID=UPI00295B6125|nr:uncharacterized protein LOC132756478 [Ruditapes philippinarum]
MAFMCVVALIFLCFSNVYCGAERRLILDDQSNLAHTVSRVVQEIESIKTQQNSSHKTITSLQQQVQQLTQDLTNTKTELNIAKSTVQQMSQSSGSWSTYVRWGKSSCNNDQTELVYSGYGAGSNWDNTGAATNFICLVKDPYLVGNSSFNKGAQVFGAEYVIDNSNWVETSQRLFGKDITFQNAPCAVCRVPRSTVLMIPGKNTCYAGWTFEYEGLLAAGHYEHKAGSEFVCLDKDLDVIAGGSAKHLGKLFYLAEAVCGALTCPPYQNGKEITCAVCSK